MLVNLSGFVLFVILGWVFGVLVNYLADVLPVTRSLKSAVCPNCGAALSAKYYLLGIGYCPGCGGKHNTRYWVVQIGFLLAAAAMWLYPPARFGPYLGLALLVYFGLVTVVDIEHRLILDVTSIVGAVLGAAVGVWLHGWKSTLLGGLGGFGFMLGLYLLGVVFVQILGRLRGVDYQGETGMGFGDVKLGGVLGLFMGWPGIWGGLILAILSAGLVSLVYILAMLLIRRYRATLSLPYGPFLVAGAVILLYFQF